MTGSLFVRMLVRIENFLCRNKLETMVAVKEPVCPIEIPPNQTLKSIRKEHRARRSLNGGVPVYLVEDKRREQLVMAQKLIWLVDHINANVAADRTEYVSITGLHQIISSAGGLTGGYSKFRYKVHPFSIEDGPRAFEDLRKEHQKCVIVGSPSCYQVV